LGSKRPRVIFAYGLGVEEIKIRIQGTNKNLGRKKLVSRLQDLCDIIHMFVPKKIYNSPQPSKDNPLPMKLTN
jgi:hypothetical protein